MKDSIYKQQLLILSTDESIKNWKSLKAKLASIKKTLNKGANANFEVTLKYINTTPVTSSERNISHSWLEALFSPYFKQGYDIIGLHMSIEQWNCLKLVGSKNGGNPDRDGEMGDFYFKANENTRHFRGGNQFVNTLLHELAHEYYDHVDEPDITHEWHEEKPIADLFETMDWSKFQKNRFTLKAIYNLLKKAVGIMTDRGDTLQPRVQRAADRIVERMKELGEDVHVFSGYRSAEEQTQLYAKGRTLPGAIVTNAKAGESLHNYGVAVDIVFGKEGNPSWAESHPWVVLGKIGKEEGFEWGGDWIQFNDRPHFEMTMGYSLKDFQEKKVNYIKYK